MAGHVAGDATHLHAEDHLTRVQAARCDHVAEATVDRPPHQVRLLAMTIALLVIGTCRGPPIPTYEAGDDRAWVKLNEHAVGHRLLPPGRVGMPHELPEGDKLGVRDDEHRRVELETILLRGGDLEAPAQVLRRLVAGLGGQPERVGSRARLELLGRLADGTLEGPCRRIGIGHLRLSHTPAASRARSAVLAAS